MSACVGGGALRVVETVHDDADVEPEEAVDLAHPLRVAAGEVVVHRDHVHALAGERVEIDRQGRDQGLALAGPHLGDRALVQDHAADELHVEVALAEGALGGLAHGGEGRDQDVVEGLAGGKLGLELLGAGAQLVVRERREFGLQRVDGRHLGLVGLQPAVVDRAEDFLRERTEHRKPSDYQEFEEAAVWGRLIDLIMRERILKAAPAVAQPGITAPRPSGRETAIASDPVT